MRSDPHAHVGEIRSRRAALTAIPTRCAALFFGGQDLDVFELDGHLWIRKDQMATALQHPLFSQSSYYARWFTPWSTRIVQLDCDPDVRLLSFYGAATLARRIRAPGAPALAAHLDRLDELWSRYHCLEAVADLSKLLCRGPAVPAPPATPLAPRSNSPRGVAA